MTTLSFIMATRNAERFIAEALASTASSLGTTPVSFEILIADGKSNDATIEIASAHPDVRIVSYADDGIYDGMNRAISAASGRYCLILNSDDVLADGVLGQALALLERNTDADFASSPALFGIGFSEATLRTHPGPLTLEGAMFGIPALNARLFRRTVLRDIGKIRTDVGLAADREFLARFARFRKRGVAVEAPLYLYRVHSESHTISGDAAGRSRVYEAEVQLGQALADHDDAELRRLARASRSIAGLKQAILKSDRPSSPDMALMNPVDLARGLLLARKWRGRLSGH